MVTVTVAVTAAVTVTQLSKIICYKLMIDIVCMQDSTTIERILEFTSGSHHRGEVKDLTAPTQFDKIFFTVTQIIIAGNKYDTLFVSKVTVTVTYVFDFSIL